MLSSTRLTRADLHRYQQRMADIMYERDGCMIVVPTGGGKTVTGLTTAKDLIDDGYIRCMLVLGPKRIVEKTWPDETDHWDHIKGLNVVPVIGSPRRREALLYQQADIYLVSFDNINWLADILGSLPIDHPLFDFLLIDEMSKLGKNPRGKWIRRLALLRHKFKQVHGMTGTPRPNGYEDLFAPLRFLSGQRIWNTSFDKWRLRHFEPLDYNQYQWAIRPEHEPAILAEAAKYMVTIEPDELPELPGVTTVEHRFDLPDDIRRDYKRMEKQLLALGVAAVNAGVASGKCEQMVQGYVYGEGGNTDVTFIHNEKTMLLEEIVSELGGDPTIIVYGFVEDLRILQRLYPGIPFLGAGVGSREANRHIDAWNAKQLPLLALHPASAGHGLNLQHGGNQIVWFNMTWSPEMYEQTIARIHRQGQSMPCYNHLILANATTDDLKLDRVVHKMTMQEAFNRYLETV